MFVGTFPARCFLIATFFVLAGCTSKTTKPEQYSGFLHDYSGLTETTSASGKPVLRWIDPSFETKNYSKLIFKPVVYYPDAKPGSQTNNQTLNEILAYTNDRLKSALQRRITLTTEPGPGTLVMRSAITAVNTSNEGMHLYEVLPIAMVLAAGEVASGHRTQDTNIYFETELTDSQTGKVLMRVVRKDQGKQVSNSQKPVTIDMLKPVIDNMANDAALFQVK